MLAARLGLDVAPAVARRDALQKLLTALESGKPARTVTLDDREGAEVLKELHLITGKPVMYIANVPRANSWYRFAISVFATAGARPSLNRPM